MSLMIIVKIMEFIGNLQQIILPKENGVVECKNQTNVEIVTSMMKGKSLPNNF